MDSPGVALVAEQMSVVGVVDHESCAAWANPLIYAPLAGRVR